MRAPAFLYRGTVMHARLKPVHHRFSYRVFSVLLDVARLDEIDRVSPVFAVNRWGLMSFYERDHGPRDGGPLGPYIDGLLAAAGYPVTGGRTELLCTPRVLGFAFNPLSVYYRTDATGQLVALIYEVRNTFGQHHSYVAPLQPGDASQAGVRQDRRKLFYVSPFIGMAMRYRFRLEPPGDRLKLRILEDDSDGPVLAAAFSADRFAFRTRSLLTAWASLPFITFKIVAAIHWEALRLWLKGMRLLPRPAPPAAVSFGDSTSGSALATRCPARVS